MLKILSSITQPYIHTLVKLTNVTKYVSSHTPATREATLCPNMLNAIGIFTRISKFRCFHKTIQIQKEVGTFVYNLAEFVFRRLLRQSENFSVFCKVFSQIAFRNMIAPLPNSKRVSPARALKLPSIRSHTCFYYSTNLALQNPSPAPDYYRRILPLKHFRY